MDADARVTESQTTPLDQVREELARANLWQAVRLGLVIGQAAISQVLRGDGSGPLPRREDE